MRKSGLISVWAFSIFCLLSCKEPSELVGLDLPEISKITLNEAEISVKISPADDMIREQGIILSTKQISVMNPASGNDGLLRIPGNISGDNLIVSVRELSPSTQYWVCAYAINKAGEAFSRVISFRTKTFKDIDGNCYGSIKILDQEWMTENLKVTRLRDGTPIQKASHPNDFWAAVTPLFMAYDHSDSLAMIFGYHYNWWAASHELIAPEGWRVATSDDWRKFGEFAYTTSGSLHIMSDKYWKNIANPANPNAHYLPRNQSGFNLLPAGMIAYDHEVEAYASLSMYRLGTFWASTEWVSLGNFIFISSEHYMLITNFYRSKNNGASIRLIRDE
jgi:uncharacterized protein (TIGR02145 family)